MTRPRGQLAYIVPVRRPDLPGFPGFPGGGPPDWGIEEGGGLPGEPGQPLPPVPGFPERPGQGLPPIGPPPRPGQPLPPILPPGWFPVDPDYGIEGPGVPEEELPEIWPPLNPDPPIRPGSFYVIAWMPGYGWRYVKVTIRQPK